MSSPLLPRHIDAVSGGRHQNLTLVAADFAHYCRIVYGALGAGLTAVRTTVAPRSAVADAADAAAAADAVSGGQNTATKPDGGRAAAAAAAAFARVVRGVRRMRTYDLPLLQRNPDVVDEGGAAATADGGENN